MISGILSYSFRSPMQLRLFLATFVSHRTPILVKMSRGMKSIIQSQNVGVDRHVSRVAKGGFSSTREQNSPQKLIDGAEKQTENLFDPANDDDFPSLSASLNMSSKGKWRTRIEPGIQLEQKSEQRVEETCSPQLNASLESHSASQPDESPFTSGYQKKQVLAGQSLPTSSSHPDESTYPSGFQKNSPSRSDSPHTQRISPEQGVSLKDSRDTKCKPFDICLSDGRKQAFLKPSLPIKEQCIQIDSSVIQNAEVLRPGMVLLKSYIPLSQQVEIILRCRELGLGSGGFYQPGYQDGAKFRLQMMCLGLDWDPQTRKYGSIREHDNSKPPDIPLDFNAMVKRVLHDAHTLIKEQSRRSDVEEILPSMSPDICIVNFYTTNGRLGLHQDRDESRDSLRRGLPVVSFSIGDTAEFLYGDERDIDKAESVLLESGDVLIFGGKSRHIFHGVASIIPKTTPNALLEHPNLRPGRLNLTFRKY